MACLTLVRIIVATVRVQTWVNIHFWTQPKYLLELISVNQHWCTWQLEFLPIAEHNLNESTVRDWVREGTAVVDALLNAIYKWRKSKYSSPTADSRLET